MAKAKSIGGYDARVTEACERVLVTLLRHLGPWRESVFLVGGLTPRYLIEARPPEVPAHAGTADVDVVVDIAMLTDTEAYRTLEANLREMNFHRAVNEDGIKQSWRWQTEVDGATMILEFLVDDPDRRGGKVEVLPVEGKVSAVNIPHSSMVVDFHKTRELKAELLNGKGVAVEKVRFADIVSFTCLKSLAYDDRIEPKDAHDLVYCLEHYPGGVEAAVDEFLRGLETKHREVILDALGRLSKRFRDGDPDQSYRLDGPVAVAAFEGNDAGIEEDEGERDSRILRQRRAADVVAQLLGPLIG
ncbi:hypothetical protein SAMN05428974_1341 [Sphingopyxis sp. YR583]|uniref:hypothetical protein n=1 Tax=Sphingopyxis sp. YR583 TaxID=1881047 RepID=UPI0008A7D4A9|nr:hypothetical protein [Sphingopyxis sp. YR583]SEH15058.1 hypothetical protein SAMN05428974_1341 [Sphingopyxis sp. YR583]